MDTGAPDTNELAEGSRVRWQWPEPASDSRVVAGVAAGIAQELGLDPAWVRLSFVALFIQGGWGLVLYCLAWAVMENRRRSSDDNSTPIERRRPKGVNARERLGGLALVVAGLMVFVSTLPGVSPAVMAPVGLVGAGAVLAYRATQGTSDSWSGPVPVVAAAGCVVAGAALLLPWGLDAFGVGAWFGVLALLAALAVTAPWWWRLVRDLDEERQARVRADERAEVAAHLHDSVLQTLTLIQKADDPAAVRSLARRQERELRNWIDPGRVDRRGRSLRGQIDELADDVEALHGVAVEAVVVGDCPVDEHIDALVAAAREAVVNAAKHAGVDRVDLFAEVRTDGIDVFVRDQGQGFDPESVPMDRLGLRESIRARMRRVGGTAHIESAPGGGTEVELRLEVGAKPETAASPTTEESPS